MNKLQKFIITTILCISVTLVLIHNPLVCAIGGVRYSGDPNRTIALLGNPMTGTHDTLTDAWKIPPQEEGYLTLTWSGEHEFLKLDWQNFIIYNDMSLFVNAIKQQYSYATIHWMQVSWAKEEYDGVDHYKVTGLILHCLIKNDAPVPTTSEATLIGCVGTNVDRRFIPVLATPLIIAIIVLASILVAAAVAVIVWMMYTCSYTLNMVMSSAKNLFGDWGVLIIGIIIVAIIIWALVSLVGGGIKLPSIKKGASGGWKIGGSGKKGKRK